MSLAVDKFPVAANVRACKSVLCVCVCVCVCVWVLFGTYVVA